MMEVIIIASLAAGIYLATWKEMAGFYAERAAEISVWTEGFRGSSEADIKAAAGRSGLRGEVNDHIRLLLQVTMGMGTGRSVKAFWMLSAVPGAVIFIMLIEKISLYLALSAALLAAGLPYGLLCLRLQKLRIDSSREGEILITELLNNYKISYFNMQQAIEETARTIEEAPNSKKLLFNLSRGLNTAAGNRRISTLLREFRLSLNTSWGNILASNMYFALASGTEVTEALTDLADTVKRARKVDEYARRENNEAHLILRYLAPLSYLLTAAGGIWYFGLTPEKFLYYQFRTEVGLTWFTISAVLYGTGLLLNGWLSKTKLDF